MKYLLNIRGAVASGKTTAVRQFCERNNFRVEIMRMKKADVPVSLMSAHGKTIAVIGDYAKPTNCVGCDSLRYRDGSSATKKLIAESIIFAYKIYNPDIIVFEHMLSSQLFKSTDEIAKVAKICGYEYYGVQLKVSEKEREKRLYSRSGLSAKKKNFYSYEKRVRRATEMLLEHGYFVSIVDVETLEQHNMWRVVDDAVKTLV